MLLPVREERVLRIRQEHADLLAALERLEVVFSPPRRPSRRLASALHAFLDTFDACLGPHLDLEARELYPELCRHLSSETGSTDALRSDHEALRGLLALLHQERARLDRNVRGAASDTAVAIRDLTVLFRQHSHRIDAVIQPLLKSLEGRTHG